METTQINPFFKAGLRFRKAESGLSAADWAVFMCACDLDARSSENVISDGAQIRRGLAAPDLGSLYGQTYQTRQDFAGTIGWPCLQPKALPNASKFCTEPLTRQRPGEWGSVSAAWRADCSV